MRCSPAGTPRTGRPHIEDLPRPREMPGPGPSREPAGQPRSPTNLVITRGTEYHLIDWIPSFEVVEIPELQPNFDKLSGMVPVIAQDAETGEVLMLAWMNRDAFEETL